MYSLQSFVALYSFLRIALQILFPFYKIYGWLSLTNKWTKALKAQKRRGFSAWPQKEWQEGGLRHWTTNEKKSFDVNIKSCFGWIFDSVMWL